MPLQDVDKGQFVAASSSVYISQAYKPEVI